MLTLKETMVRKQVISNYVKKFDREIAVLGGVIGEYFDAIKCEDYIKFYATLSEDIKIGNMFASILNDEMFEITKALVNGDYTYRDYVSETIDNDEILEMYDEHIQKVEA